MKTLKELFENYLNMDYSEHFRVTTEDNRTTITGKYNTLNEFNFEVSTNEFNFEVSTSYFKKLSKRYLGYYLKPENN